MEPAEVHSASVRLPKGAAVVPPPGAVLGLSVGAVTASRIQVVVVVVRRKLHAVDVVRRVRNQETVG